jgi:serine/threonine protein kinase
VDAATVSQRRPRSNSSGEPGLLLKLGEVLDGHYEIVDLLGSGGMAEVYLGFDRWLQRKVAIKTTPRELTGHLEREAQALASFQHPGLVAAYAYGRHRDAGYLILEYLRGDSLNARLHRQSETEPCSVDDALRLVVGVAEALAPLHERGFVHCDLKPGNVMCTPDRVVLIDLGLVWDPRAEKRDGKSSGSPPFMAPEIISGVVRPEQAHLVDVYALGMILYTLLAGAPPFVDPDPQVVMRRQVLEPAPRLATKRRDLPPRLSEIVASLIHREPGERPQDILTVRDTLLGVPRRVADRR